MVSLETTAPCFVLHPSAPLPEGLQDSRHAREFSHIHAEFRPEWGWTPQQGGGGGSQHTTLAPRDARLLIERGQTSQTSQAGVRSWQPGPASRPGSDPSRPERERLAAASATGPPGSLAGRPQ